MYPHPLFAASAADLAAEAVRPDHRLPDSGQLLLARDGAELAALIDQA
jgi:hypothetical protein